MPSSVARLVGLDHERLIRLLKRACESGPNQDRWRNEFASLLRAHRVAERDELLDEIAKTQPELAPAAARQDQTDHELDRVADQVTGADLADAAFADLCGRARHLVATHGESLRTAVLDPLGKVVGRKEMRRLGGCYESRRDEQLRVAQLHPTPSRRLDVSRAELYELAKRAGVGGRSGMSRDELIIELQRRQIH